MISRELEEIKLDLELEGRVPGSKDFNFNFLERKVHLCQIKQGVGNCTSCQHHESCELVRTYIQCKVYGEEPPVVEASRIK